MQSLRAEVAVAEPAAVSASVDCLRRQAALRFRKPNRCLLDLITVSTLRNGILRHQLDRKHRIASFAGRLLAWCLSSTSTTCWAFMSHRDSLRSRRPLPGDPTLLRNDPGGPPRMGCH